MTDWRDQFFRENPALIDAYWESKTSRIERDEDGEAYRDFPVSHADDKNWCDDCGGDQGTFYTQGENTVCEFCLKERMEEGDIYNWGRKE